MQFRVLIQKNLEDILTLEREKLAALDETERMLIEWKAPWRTESLEFYLNNGWSFGAFDGDKLCGYFLAQPFLFFRSYTQSLWLEYLTGTTKELKTSLMEIAYKTAREKHLQKLLISKTICDKSDLSTHLPAYSPANDQEETQFYQINTTKMSGE